MSLRDPLPRFPLIAWGVILAAITFVLSAAQAQEAEEDTSLSLEQQSLAARFERLEAVAAKLAELAAASEPERAAQLREAIRSSREMGTRERFSTIVELLRQEQLTAASRNQDELHSQLKKLLEVLLEDPSNDDREKLKEKLRGQIRELGRMIRQQRSLRAQNQNGRDANDVADGQQELQADAAELQNELNEDASQESADPNQPTEGAESDGEAGESQPSESQPNESQPSESQPSEGAESGEPQPGQSQPSESQPSESQPGEPQAGSPPNGQSGDSPPQDQEQAETPPSDAAQRIAAARQAMQEAEQKLRDAKRDEAADKQREAQRQLEEARAELERILRQLREEEMEQLLTQLGARFREMLSRQRVIYEETVAVDIESQESEDRAVTLKAVRLSRREAELVKLADRALVLLREDGTSVAFTEALEQIREDMQTVVSRLATPDTGALTQAIEEEIIVSLEESVAALDMALDELAQQQAQSAQGQQGGQPADPPLVSKLAELRMIRTLQGRINSRTKTLDLLLQSGEAKRAEVREQLSQLAERQQRVFEATRDLDSNRNR